MSAAQYARLDALALALRLQSEHPHRTGTVLPPPSPVALARGERSVPPTQPPTAPSEAELAECEERLQLTALAQRQTVRARRGRR